MKANDKTRITAAEMRFITSTVKYILRDYKRNNDVIKELKTEPVMGKILEYKNNWIQHVNRTQRDRISKLLKITNLGEEETEDDSWTRSERVHERRNSLNV
jgi:hypothetical protein